jgi:hypothetical protein
MRFAVALVLLLLAPLTPVTAAAQSAPRAASGQKWVVAWAGSIQGPYPIGNPSAQPEMKLAFPSDEAGARDQSFRMILKPEIWGREARMRFSNVLGTNPVTFDGVYIGVHLTSSALVPGTNRPSRSAASGASRSRPATRRGATASPCHSCATPAARSWPAESSP